MVFASKARCGQGPAAAGVVRWGMAAMGCVAMGCGWAGFRSAPTGHDIPAQGETLGTRHTRPMRSEGTPHRPKDRHNQVRGFGLGYAWVLVPESDPRQRLNPAKGCTDSFTDAAIKNHLHGSASQEHDFSQGQGASQTPTTGHR